MSLPTISAMTQATTLPVGKSTAAGRHLTALEAGTIKPGDVYDEAGGGGSGGGGGGGRGGGDGAAGRGMVDGAIAGREGEGPGGRGGEWFVRWFLEAVFLLCFYCVPFPLPYYPHPFLSPSPSPSLRIALPPSLPAYSIPSRPPTSPYLGRAKCHAPSRNHALMVDWRMDKAHLNKP